MPPENPTAIQEPVETPPSQDTVPDLAAVGPEILPVEDIPTEELPEKPSEAIAEQPEPTEEKPEEPPAPEDVIGDLSQEAVDEIIRRRGPQSPEMQELLRRERQGVGDTLSAERERAQTQQQDLQRVLATGQGAISAIGSELDGMERVLKQAKDGEEITGGFDKQRMMTAINTYRDAWVQGQAVGWNRQVADAFAAQDVVVASMTDEDTQRLNDTVRAGNRNGDRMGLLTEMFTIAVEKGLQAGYQMSQDDLRQYGERQTVVEGQKDALRKLQATTPTTAPEGGPAKAPLGVFAKAGDASVPDDEINMEKLRADLAALQ